MAMYDIGKQKEVKLWSIIYEQSSYFQQIYSMHLNDSKVR